MTETLWGMRAYYVVLPVEDRYLILARPNGARGILCCRCARVSWHLEDVARRYCGQCHLFHEEPTR